MFLINLGIRAAALVGLAAAFLVVAFNGLSQDARPEPSLEERPALTATPSPTATVLPTPTLNLTPPPPQAQLCNRAGPPPPLTEVAIPGARGYVIARAYCSGAELKYVTFVDQYGTVERTYLFEDGQVLVKLYHSDGYVFKREDFDAAGNPVPDGTYINLPNSRIGPGLDVAQP